MSSYQQQLRDPRWQKKRLEVMERDDFKCRRCESATKTLNVHHLFYEKGMAPWDYPGHSLVTFCEDHHKSEERDKTKWDWDVAVGFRRLGATNVRMERVAMMLSEIDRLGKMPGAALSQIEDALDVIWQQQVGKKPPQR